MIDSATPYQFDLPSYPTFYALWRRGSALLPTLARAGIARVYSLGMGASTLPPDARRQARAFSSLPREVRADRDEFAELKTVLHQDQALTSLDGKPLYVLTADLGQQSGWFASQDKLATLSYEQCPSDDARRDACGPPRRGALRGRQQSSDRRGGSFRAYGDAARGVDAWLASLGGASSVRRSTCDSPSWASSYSTQRHQARTMSLCAKTGTLSDITGRLPQ